MKNKGFSLVELIVVIAIMAILVGVAVPVYTSYIGKANAAKDEQLLGEINSAFMVAAVADGVTDFTFANEANDNKPAITVADDGTIDIENMKPDYLADAMVEILGTDLKFSVIEDIWYNSATRQFEDNVVTEYTYGGGKVYLSAEDVANLKASTFATEMTVQQLLDKVSDVTGYAALMSGTDALTKVFQSEAFRASATQALKVDASELSNKVGELAAQIVQNDTSDPKITLEEAIAQVQANAAVLFAAQNAVAMNPTDITTLLSQDGVSGKITEDLNNDAGAALSKAALAYGMYTSYAYYTKNEELIAKTDDPVQVLAGLDDDGFQQYITSAQGQKDLEGYLSSLNMIDSSSGDPDAVENLMINGFADPELVALLTQSMNN